MAYFSKEVDIKLNPNLGVKCLHFDFKGRFTEEASKRCVQAWNKEFSKSSDLVKYILIWDCTKMTGFEIAAKNVWKKNLDDQFERIDLVFIVSDNIVFRGAAQLMLRFLPIKFKVVKTLADVDSTKTVRNRKVNTQTDNGQSKLLQTEQG